MEGAPFQIFSTIFFCIAIVHVFICDKFQKKARSLHGKERKSSRFSLFEFLGNTTLIFGLWLIPILILMLFLEGPSQTLNLIQSIDYVEPFAYFVLITLATVRPVLQLFDSLVDSVSKVFHNKLILWWLTVLVLSALLTGCFSEIAVMTLTAQFLATRFFPLHPSKSLTYFTFSSLLLVIAVGTTIVPINFSFFFKTFDSDLTRFKIFTLFGWKTLVALLGVLSFGLLFYRKEFDKLQRQKKKVTRKSAAITARHFLYLFLILIASFGKENPYILMMVIATVVILHKAAFKIVGQEGKLSLYLPLLIAFFTTTLEFHASLQKWWVEPLLTNIRGFPSFGLPYLLTGLNEHVPLAALKTTLIQVSEQVKFLSYLGVLAGGALTFIAKSSNIVAKKLLKTHFSGQVISPFMHLAYALPLTFIFAMIVLILSLVGG